jgi:ribonuclease HII
MTLILGIDEAGKGPVLASLFIAGYLVDEKNLGKLEKLGVKDSKLLSQEERINISKDIKKIAEDYKIIQILAKEIDNAIDNDSNLNLNWLEANKTAELINTLKLDKAIVDCPSVNLDAYRKYLLKILDNKNIELIVEHKAEKFMPVAAASILAKVEREKEMDTIKEKYGDTGSGYLSDPKTQLFLKENWNKHPEIFRKSWRSWKKFQIESENKKLSDF